MILANRPARAHDLNVHGLHVAGAGGARRAGRGNIFPTAAHRANYSAATSRSKAAARAVRAAQSPRREGIEQILRTARYLPACDRKLIRDFYLRGEKIVAIAVRLDASDGQIRRRIRAIRRRMADPNFLLTVQFGYRLPEPLKKIARLHFIAGVTLAECAVQLEITDHKARQAVAVARAMLLVAGVNKYGGTDARRRAVIAALLGQGEDNFHPARLRRSAASA